MQQGVVASVQVPHLVWAPTVKVSGSTSISKGVVIGLNVVAAVIVLAFGVIADILPNKHNMNLA